jgi:uncharacterized protein involved in outer membrane biogenesis
MRPLKIALKAILKWILVTGAVLIVVLIVTVCAILLSYDYNDLKPQIAKAVWNATGRKLTIGGDIKLKLGLIPALVLTDIKFQNAPWGTRTNLAKIRYFEIQVALRPLLKRNIEVKQLILVEPEIVIETNKHGKSNLVFAAPQKPIPPPEEETTSSEYLPLLAAFTFNKTQIKNGCFVYRNGYSGKTHKVKVKLLTASAAGIGGPVKISINGDYHNHPFNVTGAIAPPATLLNSDKAWSLNLIVKALNATVTLDGSVKDIKTPRGIDFGFRIKARNLTKLSQLAGKKLPRNEPFEMAFRATDIGLKAYRLSDFKATLGRSDISGSIDVNLVKKTPLITAKLLSKKIDLRPYLPAFGNSSSSDPLLFGALKHAEGTVTIQADRFLLLRVALNHLTAKITLKGGRLTIRPIKAAIGGGKFNGRLTIKPRRKAATVTTQLKIEDCNLGYMLKGLNITDTLDGTLNADINLKGQGRSMATLMAGLDGSTNIQINQGRINNKYINLLGADLSAGIFSMLDPKKETVDYTRINCLVSRFDIKKGLAVSTVTVFDTNSMSVFGEGEINLKTKKIDFALHPIPKDGIGFRGIGKISLSLSGLSDSFKLGGTMAEPSLTLNPTGSAATLGKAIGGFLLLGPFGIAAALVNINSDDETPCLTALEVIKKMTTAENNAKTAKKKRSVNKSTKSISKSSKSVGNKLKKSIKKVTATNNAKPAKKKISLKKSTKNISKAPRVSGTN